MGKANFIELIIVECLPNGVHLGMDLVVDVFGVARIAAVLFGDAMLADADVTCFDFKEY